MKNILCIGAGYVGGPTMAMIAAKCPTYKITVVDLNAERIAGWNSGTPPIFEPGLEELVRESLNRNLFFSTDVAAGIAQADIIFVSVNTPTKTYGEGAGRAADLQYWERVSRDILAHATRDCIVVEKSTVPVRTAHAMARILNGGASEHQFEVLSNPEFLAEGTAVRDLTNPDRVLIGGEETPAGDAAVQTMVDVYAHWVPQERIITTNVWSSELSKLAANAFLAQRISSINAISAFCEKTGANVREVAKAIGMDDRIGSRFLHASIGFGGSCFRKDILNLVYLCEHYGLEEVASYWNQVVEINEYQKRRFVLRIVDAMFNTVVKKRIAVLGFAFKADTGDTRETPAITVCQMLAEERASVIVSDPQAIPNARKDLVDLGDAITYEEDPYAAAEGAHALVVLTEWKQYRDLDFKRIFDSMQKPAFIFDGRNILDHAALHEMGYNVYPIGSRELTHF